MNVEVKYTACILGVFPGVNTPGISAIFMTVFEPGISPNIGDNPAHNPTRNTGRNMYFIPTHIETEICGNMHVFFQCRSVFRLITTAISTINYSIPALCTSQIQPRSAPAPPPPGQPQGM